MENTDVTKESKMLLLMAEVFNAEAETVAKVLKSMPDSKSDELINLVMESPSDERLNLAINLFQEALIKINE